MMAAIAAGLGGVIIARALGPTVRGEYAAITAWFGLVLMVGAMGQPAALCFHVARDPDQAPRYVATARAMMLATGTVATVAGIAIAPTLAHGNSGVELGYQISFAASSIAFVGASYTFALQARDLRRWNITRVVQPMASLFVLAILWKLRLLTLNRALAVLSVTMLMQLVWAYVECRKAKLVPGRADAAMVRPLGLYGIAQIAALTPATLNSQLDQLILSQTVVPAELGRYAVAVSLTLMPVPLVAAIGNVAFPWLASQQSTSLIRGRLQKYSIIASIAIATAILVPLAGSAHWLIPIVFGPSYSGSVVLVWILAPGAVFLACGQVVGDLLRGKNLPLIVAKAQGLAAVFTVILLLALLPIAGIAGAAIASTIAYGVALAIMLRALARGARHHSRHSIGAKRRSLAHRTGIPHPTQGRHRSRMPENAEQYISDKVQ